MIQICHCCKRNIWIKTIAIVVVCLFLDNDIVWALDVIARPASPTLTGRRPGGKQTEARLPDIDSPAVGQAISSNETLAAQSRLKPFFGKHELEFQNIASVVMAANELKDLIIVKKAREGAIYKKIGALNQLFRNNDIEIEKQVKTAIFECSEKEYKYAVFHFKKERKTVNVLFFEDHSALTPAELAELRIQDTEKHHLDCSGLEGVWFINTATEFGQLQLRKHTQRDLSPELLIKIVLLSKLKIGEEPRNGKLLNDPAKHFVLTARFDDFPGIVFKMFRASPSEHDPHGFRRQFLNMNQIVHRLSRDGKVRKFTALGLDFLSVLTSDRKRTVIPPFAFIEIDTKQTGLLQVVLQEESVREGSYDDLRRVRGELSDLGILWGDSEKTSNVGIVGGWPVLIDFGDLHLGAQSEIVQIDQRVPDGGTMGRWKYTHTTLVDAEEEKAKKMHDENLKYAPAIPEKTVLCHIIADSILPVEQRNMLKSLEQDMRGEEYSEKIVSLSGVNPDNPEEFMAATERIKIETERIYKEQGIEKVEFVVACPNADMVSRVQNRLGIKALAFKPCKEDEADIVQVEGIMLALRALHSGKIESLKAVFRIINGEDLPPNLLKITDIDELARRLIFILPAAKAVNYSEIKEINDIIKKNIEAAA